MVFKLNHDPLGPEQNAGDTTNCDVERAVVAVGGCSFALSFTAQVVADNQAPEGTWLNPKGLSWLKERFLFAVQFRASCLPAQTLKVPFTYGTRLL